MKLVGPYISRIHRDPSAPLPRLTACGAEVVSKIFVNYLIASKPNVQLIILSTSRIQHIAVSF